MSTPSSGRVERARIFLKSPSFYKMWRYATVSVVSTCVSLGMLGLLFGVVKLTSAAWCNVIATVIATGPSYYLNRTWAWGKSGRSHLMREVVPFWVIAFVSLVLSTGAVKLASSEAHHLTHSHAKVTLIVELANLFTYAVLWVGKYLIFNRLLFASPPDKVEQLEPDAEPELAPADLA